MEIKLTNVIFFFRKKLLTPLMRTFIFLFCTTVFSFTSNIVLSQNAKIKIEADKTVTVNEVFDLIMNQTNYTFIYQVEMFKDYPKVQLEKGIIRANELLKKSLSDGDFNFSFTANNTIVIKEKSMVQQNITGKVTDVNNSPLVGVTVLVKGSNKGVSTDFGGNYAIAATIGDTLVFSFLGKQTTEFEVVNNKTIDIVLQDTHETLEEVVLVGYGNQKRSQISSAVSSIKSAAITKNAIGNTSFDRAMEGLATGIKITSVSGEPGAGVDINIRGVVSPFAGGNNNPLFVIDGVPFFTSPSATFRDNTKYVSAPNPLLALNPNDIESIDVLKDASATAIYGSRGANGVIIVKTKRGKRNSKIQVSLNLTSTFAKPIGTTDFLNASDYKIFQDELIGNSVEFTNVNSNYPLNVNELAYTADFTKDPITGLVTYNGLVDSYFGDADVNWADEVFRNTASTQKYDLNINGGGENSNYSFGINYADQDGLVVQEKYKQYNFKAAIDSKINKTFNFGTTLNIGYLDANSGRGPNENINTGSDLNARPDFPVRDENRNILRLPSMFNLTPSLIASPLGVLTQGSYDRITKSLIGNIYVEANLFKNFNLKYDFNALHFISDSYQFFPTLNQSLRTGLTNNALGILANTTDYNIVSNLTANYNTTINKHSIGVLAGLAYDRSTNARLYIRADTFPDDLILTTLSSAANVSTHDQTTIDTGLNSAFGRVAYNYNNKYFVTVNLRTDTSIKFGPNNRRAYFPSVAASWNISNENFLVNNTTVNNLRLRGSAGRTGSTNIGDFVYQQFFGSNISYVGVPAVGPLDDLPNVDIKWETTEEVNFGLDFGLFNNRLRGSLDIYNKKTTGALTGFVLPLETGATNFVANFADISNQGFEIEIGGDIVKAKDFIWSADLMIAQNRNRLDKFSQDGIEESSIDFYEVGEPVNVIRGYVVEHIFNDQAELDALNTAAPDGFYQEAATGLGDYKYVDLNDDGEITLDDRKILGSAQDDYFGSFNTSFTYKNFQLSALFNFSKGAEATLRTDFFDYRGFEDINSTERYFNNRWTPTNTNAKYARAILDDPNNNRRTSDRLVYDTSYIRLRSLQLGYTLPINIIEHIGFSSASLFIAGTNLWTSTDFPGVDPASRSAGVASNNSVRNSGPYPIAKTWSLGVNFKF